jgi:hypothetical protein
MSFSRVFWIVYATAFVWLVREVIADDIELHYSIYFVVPAAITYISVALCVVAYSLGFYRPWLCHASRYILVLFVLVVVVEFAMDAILPTDYNIDSPGWGSNIPVVLAILFPAGFAVWKVARRGS